MTEQQKDSAGESNTISKRSVLKAFGTGVAGLAFPYGSVSALGGGSYGGEFVIVKTSPENRLSTQDVHEIQKEAVSNYKAETGTDEAIGTVVPSVDSDVLSLVYRIDPTGETSTYLGAVPKGASVSKARAADLHKKADEHAKKVRGGIHTEYADRTSASGVARAGNTSGWDRAVNEYAFDYDDCPDGGIYMGGTVYEKAGTDYYGYGIDHIHRPNPGNNYCSDSYVDLGATECRHNWEYFDRDPPILHEHHPNTDKNGDFSVSGTVGYMTADITVTYDPPEVYRDVTADKNDSENVIWDWDFSSYQSDQEEFNPTSVIKSQEQAVSGSYASNRLLEVVGKATWDNFNTSSSSLYLYVE